MRMREVRERMMAGPESRARLTNGLSEAAFR
jgi:hypothetical protein